MSLIPLWAVMVPGAEINQSHVNVTLLTILYGTQTHWVQESAINLVRDNSEPRRRADLSRIYVYQKTAETISVLKH